jgi:hypothetical protein
VTKKLKKNFFNCKKVKRNGLGGRVPVAHICNPSYSGGRDQKDHSSRGSKPARTNSSGDPISKKPITKTGLSEWLKLKALSSNPSTAKKKKKK